MVAISFWSTSIFGNGLGVSVTFSGSDVDSTYRFGEAGRNVAVTVWSPASLILTTAAATPEVTGADPSHTPVLVLRNSTVPPAAGAARAVSRNSSPAHMVPDAVTVVVVGVAGAGSDQKSTSRGVRRSSTLPSPIWAEELLPHA